MWLLHSIGGEATNVIFLCDHVLITGFPGYDYTLLPVCDRAFHSWFLITIYVATASYKRQSHICYFPMWSRYHYRHSHGVTTLQIFIPVITPLTLDLFNAIFSKFCNQMYLIKIWNRVQLTCLLAGSLDAHQWTSRFAVKNKIGVKREQSIYFI